jgi:hypothetical protein
MIRRIVLFCCFISLLSMSALADEGMWLPVDVKNAIYLDMRELGLELTPEQIYSVNQSSLTDAIVSLGGFCTGEIISDQGLLLTNHHCADGAIQSHSSVENDLLENGFWAANKDEELPNEGLFVRFLVRMEDVTDQVLADVTAEMSEEDRNSAVDAAMAQLKRNSEPNTHYEVQIKPFYAGNKYYLFVYETFYDVRLVGAPPGAIGNYGGETDNWMWPRHTGDFSLFRVYSGPDGKPAQYSPENIPLLPKHHLPISLKGYQPGDFSMTIGFPGTTNRYITSHGLKLALEGSNEDRINLMQTRQDILKQAMDKDEELDIMYHSKYFVIANSLKYYKGQTEGIKNRNLVKRRKDLEDKFAKWVDAKKKRQKVYGDVVETLQNAYDSITKYNRAQNYYGYSMYLMELVRTASQFTQLEPIIATDTLDQEKWSAIAQRVKASMDEFYAGYDATIDQKVFAALLKLFHKNVPDNLQPDILNQKAQHYDQDFDNWAENAYENSIFTSKESIYAFLDNPTEKALTEDPVYQVAKQMSTYREEINDLVSEAESKLARIRRKFVEGLIEMNPERKYYPDANSTMRLSYGTVQGYSPRDGVIYQYYTTLGGIVQKETPGDAEFDAPDELLEIYEEEAYGRYDENDIMEVNFLSNNDITGGNSGSPVINGKGELIGVAFDGNWEAMSSDLAYEPELQRTISVDIRYVLLVIDKFAEAGHLVEEMTLVK